MKKYILILILFLFSGCSFLYDSRNQNLLNIGDASYKGVDVKKTNLKTGRLIKIEILQCSKEKD